VKRELARYIVSVRYFGLIERRYRPMSNKAQRIVFAVAAVVALLLIVVFLIRSCSSQAPDDDSAARASSPSRPLEDSSDDGGSGDRITDADDPESDGEDELVPVANRTPPRDTPRPPAPKPESKPGSKPAPKPPAGEWERYLRRTKAIVQDNSAALKEAATAVTDAIATDNLAAVTDGWAPDEGAGAAESAAYLDSYPELLDVTSTNTVTVWTNGEVTVYFAYAVVTWRDGGVTSEHTIAIPMRFINGAWYLSTYGPDTPGLVFVQSIRI
jgi:hypothetical protein